MLLVYHRLLGARRRVAKRRKKRRKLAEFHSPRRELSADHQTRLEHPDQSNFLGTARGGGDGGDEDGGDFSGK